VVEQKIQINESGAKPAIGRSWVIGLTSFFFIVLQSACTAVMAISGLRLLIGISSLTFAASGASALASIHGNAVRVRWSCWRLEAPPSTCMSFGAFGRYVHAPPPNGESTL
jgi:hypothetical protein